MKCLFCGLELTLINSTYYCDNCHAIEVTSSVIKNIEQKLSEYIIWRGKLLDKYGRELENLSFLSNTEKKNISDLISDLNSEITAFNSFKTADRQNEYLSTVCYNILAMISALNKYIEVIDVEKEESP